MPRGGTHDEDGHQKGEGQFADGAQRAAGRGAKADPRGAGPVVAEGHLPEDGSAEAAQHDAGDGADHRNGNAEHEHAEEAAGQRVPRGAA